MRLCLLLFVLSPAALARDIAIPDVGAFAAAAKVVQPGDTLVLQDGAWADARLKLHAEGTAEKPVTIKAQTQGRVVLTGDSRISIAGRHVIVDGLWFQNPAGEEAIELRIDSDELASDCRITNCADVSGRREEAIDRACIHCGPGCFCRAVDKAAGQSRRRASGVVCTGIQTSRSNRSIRTRTAGQDRVELWSWARIRSFEVQAGGRACHNTV